MRYEADLKNGWGYQPIPKEQARALLARFNLTLRNVGFYGVRLPMTATIRVAKR